MRRLSRAQLTGTILTVAVVAAVAAGIFMLDSPAVERALRLDDRRVGDLARIASAVDLYWTRHARIPGSLEELTREPGIILRTADPGTNMFYEYRQVDGGTYEVCGAFDRPSPADRHEGLWSHGEGRQCFRLTPRRVQ